MIDEGRYGCGESSRARPITRRPKRRHANVRVVAQTISQEPHTDAHCGLCRVVSSSARSPSPRPRTPTRLAATPSLRRPTRWANRSRRSFISSKPVAGPEPAILLYVAGGSNHSVPLVSRTGAGRLDLAVSRQPKYSQIPTSWSKPRIEESLRIAGGLRGCQRHRPDLAGDDLCGVSHGRDSPGNHCLSYSNGCPLVAMFRLFSSIHPLVPSSRPRVTEHKIGRFAATFLPPTAQMFQRVTPKLMLMDDRAAFKQMLLRPMTRPAPLLSSVKFPVSDVCPSG